MVETNVLLCDYCGGIIPAGAPCYRDVTATILTTAGNTVTVGPFAFCCTAHSSAKLAATLYPIAAPDPAYPVIPTS
jgi:hypothetical protein